MTVTVMNREKMMKKTKKAVEEVTISMNYDEILALSASINSLFKLCEVAKIDVPSEVRISLYSLFFRLMMKVKEIRDATGE